MTRQFRTEREASEELAEAVRWYERQRSGFGRKLLKAVDASLEFIASFPQAGTTVPDVP